MWEFQKLNGGNVICICKLTLANIKKETNMETTNKRITSFKRISYKGYRATCRYCGYSGSDWPDSGACPCCGEVN